MIGGKTLVSDTMSQVMLAFQIRKKIYKRQSQKLNDNDHIEKVPAALIYWISREKKLAQECICLENADIEDVKLEIKCKWQEVQMFKRQCRVM